MNEQPEEDELTPEDSSFGRNNRGDLIDFATHDHSIEHGPMQVRAIESTRNRFQRPKMPKTRSTPALHKPASVVRTGSTMQTFNKPSTEKLDVQLSSLNQRLKALQAKPKGPTLQKHIVKALKFETIAPTANLKNIEGAKLSSIPGRP